MDCHTFRCCILGGGGESDSNGGLVKFVQIFKSGESFLGQTLIKMELNEV